MASKKLTVDQLAKFIDHSLLKPELTDHDVEIGCAIAAKHKVATVCVKPCHVALARKLLEGSGVITSTVIGFPHGSHRTSVKVFESQVAIEDGATELDLVINIGWLKSGNDKAVQDDIAAVIKIAHDKTVIVKVILENAYLTHDEKVRAYKLAESAGSDYIKTSTGYAASGSTVEDLRLMRATVSPKVKVKAAGGVRTLPAILEAIEAGAERIGATATETILNTYAEELAKTK